MTGLGLYYIQGSVSVSTVLYIISNTFLNPKMRYKYLSIGVCVASDPYQAEHL